MLVTSVENLFHGSHDLRLLGEPADARLLLGGGHEPLRRPDETVTPAPQDLDVVLRGRVSPHLGVHGGGPEDHFGPGEDGGGEQVVAEADGGAGHGVGGGGGDEDEIGPAGKGDVLDAPGASPPGLVGVDRAAGSHGQGLLGNEAQGGFGGDDLDLVAGLLEATDHARRLVRRDAARNPHKYFFARRTAGHEPALFW